MHGETLKFVNAQQAKSYNIYKNTKLMLLKTNAAIWFNKICREKLIQCWMWKSACVGIYQLL